MNPGEFFKMIQRIKKLPDKRLIRLIRAATAELLARYAMITQDLQNKREKE